jgi:hypothetical protein
MFTTWYVASDDDLDALLAEELSASVLHLDGVGELELLALGDVLGVEYAPVPVRGEDGGAPLVLRVERRFLEALAAIGSARSVAEAWQAHAEHVAALPLPEVESLLGALRDFAKDGLAGPGIVSLPPL